MKELEKEIKEVLNNLTEELEPPLKIKKDLFSQMDELNHSCPMFIRIPVAFSFFTTIMAVPISVY